MKTNVLLIVCTIIICVGIFISRVNEDVEDVTPSPIPDSVSTTYSGVLRNVTLDDGIYGVYFDNGRVYFVSKVNSSDSFIIGRRHELTVNKDSLKKVEILNNQGSPGPIGAEPPK